jgi:hypothetical protein
MFNIENRILATIVHCLIRYINNETTENWQFLFKQELARLESKFSITEKQNYLSKKEMPKSFLERGLVGIAWYWYEKALKHIATPKTIKDIYKGIQLPIYSHYLFYIRHQTIRQNSI